MSGSIYEPGLRHVLNPALKNSQQPASQWPQQNDALCSVLLRYTHSDNYRVMRPHMGNAAAMWQALSDYHNDASFGSKLLVLRHLISCQITDDNIDAHVSNIENLGSQLSQLCAKSPLTLDDIACSALASSLPSDWNSTISSLLSQPSVSASRLGSLLRREGIRRKDHASTVSSAFAVKPNHKITARRPDRQFKSFESKKTSQNLTAKYDHCGILGHSWQSCNRLAKQWLSQSISNHNLKAPPAVNQAVTN